MYARSTTIRGNPQAMDEGIRYVRDEVMPTVAGVEGCVGLSMLADRPTGRSIVTTAWADSDTMRRSAEGVMAMRAKAAETMQGEAQVNEWEIAVLHRLHETHNGACARVTWGQCDPAHMDRMLEAFRMSMLSRLEDLPGFDSVSVMVDRETGRAAVAASYDSRHSLEQASQMASSLRQDFSNQTGMDITEVADFDIVLAHLRVPETV
jgi:quinol monooxygenase YgiN